MNQHDSHVRPVASYTPWPLVSWSGRGALILCGALLALGASGGIFVMLLVVALTR